MAAKVSDVPNSKYHSLFFILGHTAASASRLAAASASCSGGCQRQDGLPEPFWSSCDGDTSLGRDHQRHSSRKLCCGTRGGSGGPVSDTLQRGRVGVLGGPSARDGVPPLAPRRAECGLSSLNRAARDEVPHRGDVPHLSILPGSPGPLFNPCIPRCAGLRGGAVSPGELNFRAETDTLGPLRVFLAGISEHGARGGKPQFVLPLHHFHTPRAGQEQAATCCLPCPRCLACSCRSWNSVLITKHK